jgi:hypothetical protein
MKKKFPRMDEKLLEKELIPLSQRDDLAPRVLKKKKTI